MGPCPRVARASFCWLHRPEQVARPRLAAPRGWRMAVPRSPRQRSWPLTPPCPHPARLNRGQSSGNASPSLPVTYYGVHPSLHPESSRFSGSWPPGLALRPLLPDCPAGPALLGLHHLEPSTPSPWSLPVQTLNGCLLALGKPKSSPWLQDLSYPAALGLASPSTLLFSAAAPPSLCVLLIPPDMHLPQGLCTGPETLLPNLYSITLLKCSVLSEVFPGQVKNHSSHPSKL